jgi:hypothetical protein
LLHIDLARPQPESRVKTIQIARASPATGGNGSGRMRVVENKSEQG